MHCMYEYRGHVWYIIRELLVPYLVQPVPRLGERHWDAGAQVAAASVTVRKAGYCPFSLQRGQAHLYSLAEKQHSLGQRMAGIERDIYQVIVLCFFPPSHFGYNYFRKIGTYKQFVEPPSVNQIFNDQICTRLKWMGPIQGLKCNNRRRN